MQVEFAFSYAWRRWDDSSLFPSVLPSDFFVYARKSERRNGAAAAIGWEREFAPYLVGAFSDWQPMEALDFLLESDAPDEESWVKLAELFVADLTKRKTTKPRCPQLESAHAGLGSVRCDTQAS